MPRYQMPSEGGKLESISASGLRAAINAGEKIESGWLPQKQSSPRPRSTLDSQKMLAVNVSGKDIPAYGIVSVQRPYLIPDPARLRGNDDEPRDYDEFLNSKSVIISAPSLGRMDDAWREEWGGDYHGWLNPPTGHVNTWVGIAEHPIEKGSTGPVVVSGISKCLVRFYKWQLDHREHGGAQYSPRASVQDSNVKSLHCDEAGSFEILFQDWEPFETEDDGSSLHWCVVRFGGIPDGWVLANYRGGDGPPPPHSLLRVDGYKYPFRSLVKSHNYLRVPTSYLEVEKHNVLDDLYGYGTAPPQESVVAGAMPWVEKEHYGYWGWVYVGDGPVTLAIKGTHVGGGWGHVGPVHDQFEAGATENPEDEEGRQTASFGYMAINLYASEANAETRLVYAKKGMPGTLIVQMNEELKAGGWAQAEILNYYQQGAVGGRNIMVRDYMMTPFERVTKGNIGFAQYLDHGNVTRFESETSSGRSFNSGHWALVSARSE